MKTTSAFINFTKVIAYRKDTFGDNGPSNWAEFWDLENFPGKRGMHGKVNYNLEAALMADGVPMQEVYDTLATDEGTARAWAKLGENRTRSHRLVSWRITIRTIAA